MSQTIFFSFIAATAQTLYMVFISTFLSVLIGLPLGTLLFVSSKIKPNGYVAKTIGAIINISRSIPFIILLVALIPVTRFIVGTSIGINAAIVPLTLGAIPFFARLVDNAYRAIAPELIETGFSMGANTLQMVRYILLPEALSPIIHATTVTAITLVNYSAMAGTVGGGGLGDLAIRYGYQRFNLTVMLATIIMLIIIVQGIQMLGDYLANKMYNN